jgi:AcrR family transcriptional regulator
VTQTNGVASAQATLHDLAARYSPTQRRTIDAALELFSVHGVAGTSFQMIADALGVTKAAVYHQFHTKDAIVLAVLEVQLQPLEAVLETVDTAATTDETRDQLLAALIDRVVANRRSLSTLQSDPVMFRVLGEHPPSTRMWSRLFGILVGDELDDQTRVRTSVLAATLGVAVAYPLVTDVDDDTLRAELLRITRQLVFEEK